MNEHRVVLGRMNRGLVDTATEMQDMVDMIQRGQKKVESENRTVQRQK